MREAKTIQAKYKNMQRLGRKKKEPGQKKESATFTLEPKNKSEKIPWLRNHFGFKSASELLDFLIADKYQQLKSD